MALFLRHVSDPLRSRWLKRQASLDNLLSQGYRNDAAVHTPVHAEDSALRLYLRWDDPYSYLLVQQIADIAEDFPNTFQNSQVTLVTEPASHPSLSKDAWQRYALSDAHALAKQHRFDMSEQVPSLASCAKASQIFGRQQYLAKQTLHLLLQLFHMLWFNQQAKLNTLLAIHLRKSVSAGKTSPAAPNNAILVGYLTYRGHVYEGLDGLRYLVTELKSDQKLSDEAAFFIDHIDWQDDLLVNDPELVREIHESKPVLELFIALEDPRSWLILDYLMQEMASHYHIKLKLRLLPYQGLDHFDWHDMAVTAQHMGVDFAPFKRPTEQQVKHHADMLYHYKKSTRNIATRALLKSVWTHANPRISPESLDQVVQNIVHTEQRKRHVTDEVTGADVQAKLAKNQRIYDTLVQPTLPAMRMTVGSETHIWSGLERSWRIQTVLADQIEDIPSTS